MTLGWHARLQARQQWWTHADRNYRDSSDGGRRHDRRRAAAEVGRGWAWDRLDRRISVESRNRQRADPYDGDLGRNLLCHQPGALGARRLGPQRTLHHSEHGQPAAADAQRTAGAGWWRARYAAPARAAADAAGAWATSAALAMSKLAAAG